MSERLTERNANGTAKGRMSATCLADCWQNETHILERLCDIEDKIEQRKIVELPCKIGDEKFAILPNTDVIVNGKVYALIYQNGFLVEFGYNADKRFGGYSAYTQLLPEELFDTYEEAEAKVREMEGDNNGRDKQN